MFYFVNSPYIKLPEDAIKNDTALDEDGNKYEYNGKEWVLKSNIFKKEKNHGI